jgi:hypothetical protein
MQHVLMRALHIISGSSGSTYDLNFGVIRSA